MQPLSPELKKSLAHAARVYQAQMDSRGLEYLARRGLDEAAAVAHRIGLVSSPLDGHDRMAGRLVIPHLGPGGNVYDLRFRCIEHEDCKEAGCKSKYLGLPGVQTRTYNTRAIAEAGDELHVTEGEMDAISLGAAGLPAIGVPGVNALPRHFGRMVAGFSRVTMWADGDDAGRGLAEKIARAVTGVRILVMKDGLDVNSVLVNGGVDAIHRLNAGEPDVESAPAPAGFPYDDAEPPF